MSAQDPRHQAGQRIDTVDQLSSLVLLGLSLAGAVLVVGLDLLLI